MKLMEIMMMIKKNKFKIQRRKINRREIITTIIIMIKITHIKE